MVIIYVMVCDGHNSISCGGYIKSIISFDAKVAEWLTQPPADKKEDYRGSSVVSSE